MENQETIISYEEINEIAGYDVVSLAKKMSEKLGDTGKRCIYEHDVDSYKWYMMYVSQYFVSIDTNITTREGVFVDTVNIKFNEKEVVCRGNEDTIKELCNRLATHKDDIEKGIDNELKN